jgi:hypothetical protein
MHTIDPALSSEITPHITYFIRYFGDTRKSADQSKTNLSFNISAFLDFMVRHHTAEADRNKISSIEIIWYDRTESNFYATRVMFEKSASGGAVTHKYVTDGETLRDVMFKRIVFKKKYAKNLCGR